MYMRAWLQPTIWVPVRTWQAHVGAEAWYNCNSRLHNTTYTVHA